jgi:dTDP-glucose pyrophosphorylase
MSLSKSFFEMSPDLVLKSSVLASGSVEDVIESLETSGTELVVLIGDDSRFAGLITYGDLRRCLARNTGKPYREIKATECLPLKPQKTCFADERDSDLAIAVGQFKKVPLLGRDFKLVGVLLPRDAGLPAHGLASMLLMAGGEGTRLRPLTLDRPKPLIEVHGRSLIERAIDHARQFQILEFVVSVRYLKHKIIDQLGDGSHLGVKIKYLEEDEALGTAGALTLVRNKISTPLLFVQNADVISTIDWTHFSALLSAPGVDAALGCRRYVWENPFGVVEHQAGSLSRIVEKPKTPFLINAGIYAFRTEVLSKVSPSPQKIDMPDFLMSLIDSGSEVKVFEVESYWRDIGTPESLLLAEEELDN